MSLILKEDVSTIQQAAKHLMEDGQCNSLYYCNIRKSDSKPDHITIENMYGEKGGVNGIYRIRFQVYEKYVPDCPKHIVNFIKNCIVKYDHYGEMKTYDFKDFIKTMIPTIVDSEKCRKLAPTDNYASVECVIDFD